jgi:hypothetical protein
MKNLLNIYNQKHSNHAIKLFLKSDKLIKERKPKNGENKENRYFTYNLNEVEDYAVWDASLGVMCMLKSQQVYSPFALLNEYRFGGAVFQTICAIDLLINKDKIPFIRVASEYFKVLEDKELISFNKTEIRQDYGNGVFDYIKSYDKFGVFPNNIDYSESVSNVLNTYHRPIWESYKGDDFKGIEDDRIKWSLIMMNHIFGEDMLELGLEYMKMLWCKPTQMLPILVLGSEERQTGKTTFSNWLNDIFGENHVSLGLEDMKGEFNHFFAEKLIISIEETQDESHKLVNKLKRISTTEKMLVNPKGVKQYVVNFYGKLLILTNSPDSFLKIDSEEIRFWVLIVPSLDGKANHNIKDDLIDEIPYFLRLLEDLPMKEKRSRMWFHPEEILTEGLAEVKKESLNSTKKELLYLFSNELIDDRVAEVYFNASDIKTRYFRSNNLVTRNYIHKLLVEFSKEGLIHYSDKKIRYVSAIGETAIERLGTCFWIECEDKEIIEEVQDELPF